VPEVTTCSLVAMERRWALTRAEGILLPPRPALWPVSTSSMICRLVPSSRA
jgi:hypothetical protein